MVTYVLVPADETQPVQELDFKEDPNDAIGGFTKELNAHYSRAGAQVDVSVLRDQVQAHMQKQKAGEAAAGAPQLDTSVLTQFAQSQTVDIVPLMPALPTNGWTGVNMYVDDKGIAKNLPVNRRASAMTHACGCPTEVRGDAFVSRLADDQEDLFERRAFGVSELSADAAWARSAQQYNVERLARGPQQIPAGWMGKGGAGASAAPPPDPEEQLKLAAEHRAAGTAAFKASQYADAAGRYKLALDALASVNDPAHAAAAAAEKVPINLNMASAHLQLEQPFEAIAACDRALELEEKSVKAWYRRGQACMRIHQYKTARKNLVRAAELEPQNREIRRELERCAAEAQQHAAQLLSGEQASGADGS